MWAWRPRTSALRRYDAAEAFSRRDEIKRLIAQTLVHQSTASWLSRLKPADVWCAEVLDWNALLATEAWQRLDIVQSIARGDGVALRTTRTPLRMDGMRAGTSKAAPRVGEHMDAIVAEFGLARDA